jgi:hypothetical protein
MKTMKTMKTKLLIIGCLLGYYSIVAQSFMATQFDNYAGIYSVLNNPANIVDAPFRTDVNLASVSLYAANDIYQVQLSDIMNNSDFESNAKTTFTNSNNIYSNLDILGPSFMFNINKKNSIALFTRFRAIAFVKNIDGNLYDLLTNADLNQDISINNQNFTIATNSWAEVGASYARVLYQKGDHFLKAGVSFKLLSGFYSGYLKANNVSINYDYNGTDVTNIISTSGNFETGNLGDLNNVTDMSTDYDLGNGFGTDIGFVYEYRPSSVTSSTGKGINKYLIKAGISVTDIGSIKFETGEKKVYEANASFTEAEYDSNSDLNNYYSITESKESFSVSLPTAMHLNFDWNVKSKLFLNFNSTFGFGSNANSNDSYIYNYYSLTPRIESKWWSVYLPFTVSDIADLKSGFGFRAGPLTIGSSSILSTAFGYTNQVDINLGLKVPIYHTKK